MKAEGLTQNDLASMVKKSQPAISDMLTGKTKLDPNDALIFIKRSKGMLTLEKIYVKPGGASHA